MLGARTIYTLTRATASPILQSPIQKTQRNLHISPLAFLLRAPAVPALLPTASKELSGVGIVPSRGLNASFLSNGPNRPKFGDQIELLNPQFLLQHGKKSMWNPESLRNAVKGEIWHGAKPPRCLFFTCCGQSWISISKLPNISIFFFSEKKIDFQPLFSKISWLSGENGVAQGCIALPANDSL